MRNIEREFRRRFCECYDRTYRYALCRLPDKDACEDVVAETFLNAWQHRESFDAARGDLVGWVLGIARHRIADYWRRLRPEPWDDAALEELCTVPAHILLGQIERRLAFTVIMDSLKPEARALLTLRHVDGLTHEEISVVVQKSPEAVRQSLSRLHRQLRELFPEYDIDNEAIT